MWKIYNLFFGLLLCFGILMCGLIDFPWLLNIIYKPISDCNPFSTRKNIELNEIQLILIVSKLPSGLCEKYEISRDM